MTEETTITDVEFDETIEPSLFDEDEHQSQADLRVERGADVTVLSVQDAALILGKSIRALERSLSGKWGNKLPDGWSATKKIVDGVEEWQIVPPPGFRYEQLLVDALRKERSQMDRINTDDLLQPFRAHFDAPAMSQSQHILLELANAHRDLAEQRKLHMEDLRTLLELQGSMRLLEVNSSQTAKLKQELIQAQQDLIILRDQYREFLAMPWWKRLFKRKP